MRKPLRRLAARAIHAEPDLPWEDRPIIDAHTRAASSIEELPAWLRRWLRRHRRGV